MHPKVDPDNIRMHSALLTRKPVVTAKGLKSRVRVAQQPQRMVAASAVDDTNFFVNFLASGLAGAAATSVTLVTADNRDKEIERIQTPEGAIPVIAAVVADSIAHSIPGINVLLSLLSEPAGAAAGVAYMMTVILSSTAVDPATLAPKGTLINAEKAQDARAAVRVPFTRIIPTAIEVVDTTNDSSSGAGWTIGPNGLPKLPITSVAVVVGVGCLILETSSHAPVLGLFMPRVLQVAGWLAVAGWLLDKREKSA